MSILNPKNLIIRNLFSSGTQIIQIRDNKIKIAQFPSNLTKDDKPNSITTDSFDSIYIYLMIQHIQ